MRLAKSSRPTRRPAHSPQRSPSTAPRCNIGDQSGPSLAPSRASSSAVMTRRVSCSIEGSLTLRHGERTRRSSSTAAVKTARTTSYWRRTVRGDAVLDQALTRSWMSHGVMVASLREPSAGRRWLRSTDSSRARLDGRFDGSRPSHFPAHSRNVRDERRGSTQSPRLRSASSRAWKVSASLRVRNVRLYGRPSGARRRTSYTTPRLVWRRSMLTIQRTLAQPAVGVSRRTNSVSASTDTRRLPPIRTDGSLAVARSS